MQRDAMRVLFQPRLALGVQVVARPVVDDEKDLPLWVALREELQERQERLAIEDVREGVREACVRDSYCAVDVRGLAFAARRDAGLGSSARPGPMEGGIELEACLVLEENHPILLSGFFLIAGNVSSIHRC